jgi:energy-coupling factor transporter ATP-binding protein EcfA2
MADLPDLELELGPLTALVGPRGSGKSQLLSAVAWLLGAARRPATRISAGSAEDVLVGGVLREGGTEVSLARGRRAHPPDRGSMERSAAANAVSCARATDWRIRFHWQAASRDGSPARSAGPPPTPARPRPWYM